VRRAAGAREEFAIELPDRRIAAAGRRAATSLSPNGETVATAIGRGALRAAAIRTAADAIRTDRLQAATTRGTLVRIDLRGRVAAELGTVSPDELKSGRYVPAGGDIAAAQGKAVVADLQVLTATATDPATGSRGRTITRPTVINLTDAQRKALFNGRGGTRSVTEARLETILGTTLDKPAAIFRLAPELDPCRPRLGAEECLEDTPATPVTTSTQPTGGNQPGSNVRFEKRAVIAKLMDRQTAPEDPIEFGPADLPLESSLTAGGVDDVIRGLVFAPGPADVPAFHDFHDVQIAFEPIWQEALDERYLDDVASAYDQIVERGGAPAESAVTGLLTAPAPVNIRRNFIDSAMDLFGNLAVAIQTDVPDVVASSVYISREEWRVLPADLQNELLAIATEIRDLRDKVLEALDPDELDDFDFLNLAELLRAAQTKKTIAYRSQIQLLTADADRLVAHARRLLLEIEARGPWAPTHELIDKLRRHRSSAYPFRHFAATPTTRSINFGLLVTYRQMWTPISYQVGELVSTIPLAPKEIRKFSKRTVVKTKRAQSEIESNLASRRFETEERSRAEAEIISRASAKTNFSLSVDGTFNLGGDAPIGGSITTKSSFSRDAEQHSESIKKEFREAVLKSAEEYKNERKVEVSTEETFESEVTESGEIQNPNDEVPCTFLFYELQRRYKVAEKIHRLQSVVYVAQEVPPANTIDAAWLIRHDWILNRVLLDDSFRPALTYLSTTLVSEDVVLRESREALFRHRKLVEELKEDILERRVLAGLRYAALQRQMERTAESADSGGGLFGGIGDFVGGLGIGGELLSKGLDFITGSGEGPTEEAQLREAAARDAYDRERREEEEMASRLMNAISVLEAMQKAYAERLGQHLRQLTQVERLATHVAQNILYYMQAIWMYESNDQRFLRLRNVPVPIFKKDKTRRRWLIDSGRLRILRHIPIAASRADMFGGRVDIALPPPPINPQRIETTPLSEVADINRPLGFIGNYMAFPMYEANPITEFMMDPYVTLAEGEYGVSDPDPLGNMTLDEFADYVCCLKEYFEKEQAAAASGSGSTTATAPVATSPQKDPWKEIQPYLRETLQRLLQLSQRNNDEVVIPTKSLFIEALPGAHSVMERFKQLHRQVDVKAAQETLRRTAIDNVRRAQRILTNDLEDPEIESKYVFEGNGTATIVPPGGSGGTPNP
jgi:hypothetical protein